MKAALLDEFGKPMRVGDAPQPAPREDEVLVRVEACGVCHSDLHMADGDWPDVARRMTLPAILGHEVVGRVAEIGAIVDGIKAGDRVGIGWLYSTCGACEFCGDGHENVCRDRQVTGVAAPGGFAEYIRVRASHGIPVPGSLPAAEVAPLFCAGLTVYHACRNAGLRSGQRVAVFGVGGLGHLAVQLARRAGAEVIAVDTGDDKLALAESLGAARVIHTAAPDAARQLRRDGGPHLAIVTAPAKTAYDLAFRTLRRRGTLAVVGLPKEDLTFFADDWVVGEFTIVGSAVGTRDEMRELLSMAAAGEVKCLAESYALEQVNDVFDKMRHSALLGRAVLVP